MHVPLLLAWFASALLTLAIALHVGAGSQDNGAITRASPAIFDDPDRDDPNGDIRKSLADSGVASVESKIQALQTWQEEKQKEMQDDETNFRKHNEQEAKEETKMEKDHEEMKKEQDEEDEAEEKKKKEKHDAELKKEEEEEDTKEKDQAAKIKKEAEEDEKKAKKHAEERKKLAKDQEEEEAEKAQAKLAKKKKEQEEEAEKAKEDQETRLEKAAEAAEEAAKLSEMEAEAKVSKAFAQAKRKEEDAEYKTKVLQMIALGSDCATQITGTTCDAVDGPCNIMHGPQECKNVGKKKSWKCVCQDGYCWDPAASRCVPVSLPEPPAPDETAEPTPCPTKMPTEDPCDDDGKEFNDAVAKKQKDNAEREFQDALYSSSS